MATITISVSSLLLHHFPHCMFKFLNTIKFFFAKQTFSWSWVYMETVFTRKLECGVNWLNRPVLYCWLTAKLYKSLFSDWVHCLFVFLFKRKPRENIFYQNIKLMIMWPKWLILNLLLIFLIFLVLVFSFISPLIVRILITIVYEAVIIVIFLWIMVLVLRNIILLNISGYLIFHVLLFFPFFEKSDHHTNDILPENLVNILKDLFI